MNDDELMNKVFDKFQNQDFDSKASKDYKDSSNNIVDDNSNRQVVSKRHPKNLLEIKQALIELKDLREKYDNKGFVVKDEDMELTSFLAAGIVLDDIPYRSDIIDGISSFLSEYGFDSGFVLDNLKGMEGHVCPLTSLGDGKAQALRNYIDIDLEFFEFDENGNVVGVIEDKKELFKYVVTHEFFHKLSSFKNGSKDVAVMGDALLEGFTDMFAHMASGNNSDKSDLYEFPVKVCEMFTEMMGMDKVLHDYIKETGKFPNLKKLFKESGMDEEHFLEFKGVLSSVITGVGRDKKNGLGRELWGLDEKTSSLDFLRDNIIIPYCRNNPDQAERILGKFNNLFEGMGYSCSMEDIKGEKKNI